MSAVALEKNLYNYPQDVQRVLKHMMIGDKLMVVGSAALRSQQYAGDYDCFENVDIKGRSKSAAINALVKRFQDVVASIVKSGDIYITDIKAGIVDELRILDKNITITDEETITNYNQKKAQQRTEELMEKKYISSSEGGKVLSLLKPRLTIKDYAELINACKFHIVRWTAKEVAENKKLLRTGQTLTLQEAFQYPSIVKIDLLSQTEDNRISEFSCIYKFFYKGKAINNFTMDLKKDLAKDVYLFANTGNYFKALKRAFALAKAKNDMKMMERYSAILNSDLGKLYQIIGDMKTLAEFILEHNKGNEEIINIEIEQFVKRLSNIYTLPAYLKKEKSVIKRIDEALKLSKTKKAEELEDLADELNTLLQERTKKLILTSM